jgi:hypothetical protein
MLSAWTGAQTSAINGEQTEQDIIIRLDCLSFPLGAAPSGGPWGMIQPV